MLLGYSQAREIAIAKFPTNNAYSEMTLVVHPIACDAGALL